MLRSLTVAATLVACSAPAFAQTQAPLPDPLDQSDTFTFGLGAGFISDYEGSNDYRLIPAVAVRGRVAGISFFSRGTHIYADLVPRGSDMFELDAGPIVGVRVNRTRKIKDDFVDRLPELNTAVEIGGFAGVTAHGLTNPYDALSFRLDVVKDVGNAHGSTVISPTIDFGTPLSRTFYIGASLSMDLVGDGYADYYYSISPSEALASGVAPFDADGGFKSWELGLIANQSLSGDLTRGLSLFAAGSYSHLSGDFKDSPIVDDRGSASQWFGALGVAYTF